MGRSRETRKLVYPAGVVNPEDLVTFIHMPYFTSAWKKLGLTDDDLRVLEMCIMVDPRGNPVMQGTGGLRKGRFVPPRWNVGKSGALRIGYVYFEEFSVIALIVAFAKNAKANLTAAERKVVKALIERLHVEVSKGL